MTELDPAGRTDLHYAAAEGRSEKVDELIAERADAALADGHGMTPLHFAGQENHPEIAESLLDAGAPVDAQDQHGNTPLWKAVFGCAGDGDLIALLRAAGADPRRANHHGTSPLQLALRIDNYDVAQHFADLANE